ncbi:hypothetical protein FJK98_02220 [Micromonospora sp. HM134]|uniref:hypothetical protein n=1 Tax=Micromonospora sp. HM134 TaxID=2583243 RepID=UPI0011989D03|nr:hypothetical protein [Micromonospora sp. HM134]QDY06120.1 hypothetical protein FJK98_02220 [Micromonospora sp. HM134]
MTDRIPNPQPLTYGTVQPGTLVEDGDDNVFRVEHVASWRNAVGAQYVSLTVVPLGPGAPGMWTELATIGLLLASEGMVADARARQQRSVIVSGLGLVADRVRSHVLPLPTYGTHVSLTVGSPAELGVWADAFGVEVREVVASGRVHWSVTVDLGDDDAMSLSLNVSCLSTPVEPEPVPLPEHRHVAASGGQGEGTAECACGQVFFGESGGEAVAALDQHIANPEVRFPAGTPERAAYAAELTEELGKFARGEAPYEYPVTSPAPADDTTGGDR